MQLVSFAINHYVAIPYERFTDKIIAAISIFQVIESGTYDTDDELEIIWIEQNTHPQVNVPIYVLDRCINPSKGEFKKAANKVTFDTNEKDENGMYKQVTLTENQMQYHLCGAIRRVNDLIMKTVKKYNDEIPLPDLSQTEVKEGLSFEGV